MKQMRIADIAREAGVSETSVSFYINGKAKKYKLSAATCERIAAVVAKYDYVPNLHARAMLHKRTYQIGLCLYGPLTSSFWSPIIDSIEQEIAPAGCHLLLASSHRDAAAEREALRFMRSKGVDGILLNPMRDTQWVTPNLHLFQELALSLPLVSLNVALEGIHAVYNDEGLGGRLAAEYLQNSGCRRPGTFGKGHELTGLRVAAFQESWRKMGIEPEIVCSPQACAAAVSGGLDGIFCFSDYRLIELFAARRGIRERLGEIPVIGFDGVELLMLFHPRPATIVQHKRTLGRLAARRLLNLIENEETGGLHHALRPKLLPGG